MVYFGIIKNIDLFTNRIFGKETLSNFDIIKQVWHNCYSSAFVLYSEYKILIFNIREKCRTSMF